jgi:hypothetical protein
MWCIYQLAFEAGRSPDSPPRDLRATIETFAQSIVRHFDGTGCWIVATAPATSGGVDVWFNLPKLPSDEAFAPHWRQQLCAFGLVGQRPANRC